MLIDHYAVERLPSRLEKLADEAGVEPDQLRRYLEAEVDRRRSEFETLMREFERNGATADLPPE